MAPFALAQGVPATSSAACSIVSAIIIRVKYELWYVLKRFAVMKAKKEVQYAYEDKKIDQAVSFLPI